MKTVNTVVISALLAVGLAGNAMAAPSHHGEDKVVKKVFVNKAAPKHANKRVTTKKAAPARVVKHTVVKRNVVKKAAPKKVTKRVVKKAPAKVYRVRPGDTLYRIAARNHVSVDKLIKTNGLWGKKASNLKVGMVLRLA